MALGCGNFGGVGSAPEFFGQGLSDDQAAGLMDAAWEAGITHFDTADGYGGGRSERAIGRWIASRRVRPTLTSKTFHPLTAGGDRGLAPERVARSLKASLERLGVDRLELYLAHEPDPEVALDAAMAGFEAQRQQGLIDAYGGEIAYTAYSPLCGGWLTGKYRRGAAYPAGSRMTQRPEPYAALVGEPTFAALDALQTFARVRDVDGRGRARVAAGGPADRPDRDRTGQARAPGAGRRGARAAAHRRRPRRAHEGV